MGHRSTGRRSLHLRRPPCAEAEPAVRHPSRPWICGRVIPARVYGLLARAGASAVGLPRKVGASTIKPSLTGGRSPTRRSRAARCRLRLACFGTTTLARGLEVQYGAVRFSPDEWMDALAIDIFDGGSRERIERPQCQRSTPPCPWGRCGHRVGTWGRDERDELREVLGRGARPGNSVWWTTPSRCFGSVCGSGVRNGVSAADR